VPSITDHQGARGKHYLLYNIFSEKIRHGDRTLGLGGGGVGWGGDAIGVADELLNDLPVSWAPYVIYVACLQTHGVNEALLACKDTQSIKHTHPPNTPSQST
jgi:hypothetical protein